ncbi:lipoprotein 17-related variable surface protein [Mycoplasma sp. VS30B]
MKWSRKLKFLSFPIVGLLPLSMLACSKEEHKNNWGNLVLKDAKKAELFSSIYPSLINQEQYKDYFKVDNLNTKYFKSYVLDEFVPDDEKGTLNIKLSLSKNDSNDIETMNLVYKGFRPISKWEKEQKDRELNFAPAKGKEIDKFLDYLNLESIKKDFEIKNYFYFDPQSKMLYGLIDNRKVPLLGQKLDLLENETLTNEEIVIDANNLFNTSKKILSSADLSRNEFVITYRIASTNEGKVYFSDLKSSTIVLSRTPKDENEVDSNLNLVDESESGFDNSITENLFEISNDFAKNREEIVKYLKENANLKIVPIIKGDELFDVLVCANINGKDITILHANDNLLEYEFYIVNQEKPALQNGDPNYLITYKFNSETNELILKYKLAFGNINQLQYFSNNHNVAYLLK